MDLRDGPRLDDVEAVVVSKLLEGVGFVSVHLERHALTLGTLDAPPTPGCRPEGVAVGAVALVGGDPRSRPWSAPARPAPFRSVCPGAVVGNRTGSRVLVTATWARQRIPLTQFTA